MFGDGLVNSIQTCPPLDGLFGDTLSYSRKRKRNLNDMEARNEMARNSSRVEGGKDVVPEKPVGIGKLAARRKGSSRMRMGSSEGALEKLLSRAFPGIR